MQKDAALTEASDDAPNLLTLCVIVPLTCTAASKYSNGVSSIIGMVLCVE